MEPARELEHKLLQSLVRGAGAGMVVVPGEDGLEATSPPSGSRHTSSS